MASLANAHKGSMVAMHTSFFDTQRYVTKLEAHNMASIKSPISIGAAKPTGYAPSWVHKPLKAIETFVLFRNIADTKPTHNAWVMKSLNPNSRYRELWSDLIILPPNVFQKQKWEVRKRVHTPFVLFAN